MDTRMSVVQLSRGASWNPRAWEPPYLLGTALDPWPDGTVSITFTDTTGGELLTLDGDVTPDAISFSGDPDQMDTVAAGCNFEIFLDDGVDIHKVRYGKVIRREATFANPPVSQVGNAALQFTDTFPTLGLRSNWKAVSGHAQVFDNSGSSLPNGVGPNYSLFALQQAAIRWDTPLNSDTVKVNVNLLNQSDGKTTVAVCADQRFTSFLGVQFEEVGISNIHRIHLLTGTAPYTVTYRGSAITNTVVDGDNYTVFYSQATNTLSVYKGTSTSPLGSWTDSGLIVPHGPGYRYTGFIWDNSVLLPFPGIQPTYWSAKDDA